MIWDQLTSAQFASIDKDIVVVLPVSATEQHGPHLPLATDRLIGGHFANQLHQAMDDQVLILPSVGVGCSDHHLPFLGTLSLGHHTFISIVNDLVSSAYHHEFYKFLILNSHGGNQGAGQLLMEQMGSSYQDTHFVFATWWKIAAEALNQITETGPGGVGHAGEFETSLMLHIAPELVNTDRIQPGANVPTYSWAEGDMLRGAEATYYRNMEEMTPNGVYGDPTKATADKGERITKCVLEALQKIVIDLSAITRS